MKTTYDLLRDGMVKKSLSCNHEWKKTLAESGMCFIFFCDKCKGEVPYFTLEKFDEEKEE